MLGGRIDAMFVNISEALPHIRSLRLENICGPEIRRARDHTPGDSATTL
jgi:tripartite-type tricarboxylate transporter receptor subunit TctC